MANSQTNFLRMASAPTPMSQKMPPAISVNPSPNVALAAPSGQPPAAPVDTGMAPMAVDTTAQDKLLRDMASGKAMQNFDPAAIRKSMNDMFPDDSDKEKEMTRKDWGKMIMLMGLKTMAASQPGSTLGGALGQGVSGGYADYQGEQDKLDAKKQRKLERAMKQEDRLTNLAAKAGENVFDREKFDFTKEMELKRLAQAANAQNMQLFDTITDANGNTFRMNKQTGQMEPVMTPDGKPFMQATKDPAMDYIMKGINSQMSSLNPPKTPIEALQNQIDVMNAVKNMRSGGGAAPAPATGAGTPNSPDSDIITSIPISQAKEILKKDPSKWQQFEKHYGVGSSRRFLGNQNNTD